MMKARVENLRDLGPALSPFNAFLFLQGLETLPCAWSGMSATPRRSRASWTATRPSAGSTIPACRTARTTRWRSKYLPRGAGAHLHLRRQGRPRRPAHASSRALRLISHLANVGDAKTLIIHPASTTHQQLSERAATGRRRRPAIWSGISVGLEDVDDICWDLDQALRQAHRVCTRPPRR